MVTVSSEVRTCALSDFMGVEVLGVALDQVRDEALTSRLRELLAQHALLLFRNQDIGPEAQIAFSRRLGPLEAHVLSDFCLRGYPEIFVVSNIVENGRHIGAYGGSKQFHTDLAYMAEPSMGSVFRCLECPAEGGETEFVSMAEAFDQLPASERDWLRGQVAIYDYVWDYPRRQSHRPPLSEAQKQEVPPVRHPCVRRHPETGRESIFLTPIWIRTLDGMDEETSAQRIGEIIDFATAPRFRYAHRWQPGDVLIWDNRSTLHRQLPFDDTKERRLMHRTTIRGERPIAAA